MPGSDDVHLVGEINTKHVPRASKQSGQGQHFPTFKQDGKSKHTRISARIALTYFYHRKSANSCNMQLITFPLLSQFTNPVSTLIRQYYDVNLTLF